MGTSMRDQILELSSDGRWRHDNLGASSCGHLLWCMCRLPSPVECFQVCVNGNAIQFDGSLQCLTAERNQTFLPSKAHEELIRVDSITEQHGRKTTGRYEIRIL